jgi:hypothetical protein
MGDNRMERMKAELANLTSGQQAMFQQMQEMMAAMNTRLDQMTSNRNDDHGESSHWR